MRNKCRQQKRILKTRNLWSITTVCSVKMKTKIRGSWFLSENSMKDAGWLVSGLKKVKINRGHLEKKAFSSKSRYSFGRNTGNRPRQRMTEWEKMFWSELKLYRLHRLYDGHKRREQAPEFVTLRHSLLHSSSLKLLGMLQQTPGAQMGFPERMSGWGNKRKCSLRERGCSHLCPDNIMWAIIFALYKPIRQQRLTETNAAHHSFWKLQSQYIFQRSQRVYEPPRGHTETGELL